jgi:hypothetical protein
MVNLNLAFKPGFTNMKLNSFTFTIKLENLF